MIRLTASDVVSLLKKDGWIRESESGFGSIWGHADRGASVGIPHEVDEASFEWDGIISRVASAENVSSSSIIERLRRFLIDVALLRANGDTSGDSIPLDAAERLHASGRQLFRSAATTARSPKIVIGSGYSRPGDLIAAKARVGYTRSGSYVVPLLMPLSRPEEPLTFDAISEDQQINYSFAPEPAERRVTRTLAQSLTAIQTNIVDPERELLASDLPELSIAGVSRESVMAIHKALSVDGISRLKVEFEWADAIKAPATLPPSVEFSSEAAPRLKAAASMMKPSIRQGHEQLTGMVVQFRREDKWDEFWLQTSRRGRPTEVGVMIEVSRRDEVLEWIRSGEPVVVAGKVETIRGQKPRIFKPETVQALSKTYLFRES